MGKLSCKIVVKCFRTDLQQCRPTKHLWMCASISRSGIVIVYGVRRRKVRDQVPLQLNYPWRLSPSINKTEIFPPSRPCPLARGFSPKFLVILLTQPLDLSSNCWHLRELLCVMFQIWVQNLSSGVVAGWTHLTKLCRRANFYARGCMNLAPIARACTV